MNRMTYQRTNQRNVRRFLVSRLLCACLVLVLATACSPAQAQDKTLRVGIVGLDTSHVPAFTKAINNAPQEMQNCQVVAAYPYGSRDIESSASRIPKYTAEVKDLGLKVYDSLDDLLDQVDCVLLETNDGRPHLEQALQVFQAGKPVFIDKPTGAKLSDVVAIFRAAKHYQVPVFSSSSLRYSSGAQAIRNGKVGDVLGCSTYSPCALEKTHVDLFWYGIHGVEILYTCMKTGCESVSHTATKDFELAVGRWEDGRIGTFRGIRRGKSGYGGVAYGTKSIGPVGDYEGYLPLVKVITTFFRTREVPIDPAETIELYAFMQAAYESKQQGGQPVTIAQVMADAEAEADKLLAGQLK